MLISADLVVSNLRCEYKVDPLGVDTIYPRLSWIIESLSNEVSQKQTSYRIIVSSSKENLEKNIGDFWDTGKVVSNQQNQITYNGKKLKSKDICYWKVKIWDKNNLETGWSVIALWTMGLLNQNDWKAKWIGYDGFESAERKNKKFEFNAGKDRWIWYPLNKSAGGKGIGSFYFRKKFFLKDIEEINTAYIIISADEKFTLFINGKFVTQNDDKIFSWTRPTIINLKSLLIIGSNLIAVKAVNTYLEKPGLTAKLLIEYKSKKSKVIKIDASWRASFKELKGWKEIKFNDEAWSKCETIALMGEKPWRTPKAEIFLPPPPYLRREFNVKKNIKTAYAFISALGLFKLFINGKKISEDRLTPGWTDYNQRVYYNTYDVKNNLNSFHKNCAGIVLADGWYAGYIGWEKHREYYGKNPRVILQLEIEYVDGTKDIICSDNKWKASYGPLLEADLLMGEAYDARKEFAGWNQIKFNDKNWQNISASKIKTKLNSYPAHPIRKTLEIKPVKVITKKNKVHIFDLGQNIAGCVRLKINGKKTGKIILRFGEMLDQNENLYVENIRMARAVDTYFSRGKEEEIWESEFTYHGFRYVEVKGLNEKPVTDTITGIVFHSDLPAAGTFKCSDDKLNKLYQNILWSQRSNFMDIPTDCPQRDERLGWAADAIDFIRTASFNMDTSAFYTKWLCDLNDAQEKNGAYPAIAPKPELGVGPLYSGAAGFADSGVITPYFLFQYYNDTSILKKYYRNMKRFMKFLEKNNFKRPGPGYGDWLSLDADTPQDLIDAAFFAYNAKLMSDISTELKYHEEARSYKKLYEDVKNYFNENFVFNDGSIKGKTQTAYVLPLYFKLLDEKMAKKSFNFLIEDIKKRNWHISTGFIGLTYLFPVLTNYGRSDIVYKLLFNESFPSWINMLKNGATTMWERWDSWRPGKGFFDPLMNSFNHTSLGVIGEWFYSGIGGIIPDKPGFKKLIIKPKIGGQLKFASVSYNSIYGKIFVNWKIEDKKFFLIVNLPVNTSAKIILPNKINDWLLRELICTNKNFINDAEGNIFIEAESGETLITGSLK